MKTSFFAKKNIWNAVLFGVVLTVSSAHAITLDELTSTQEHFANGVTTTASSVVSSTSVVGGKRQLFVQNLATPIVGNRVEARIDLGNIVYSEDSFVRGVAVLTYNASNTNTAPTPGFFIPNSPNGLGGIDFTADGGDKIRLRILGFDYPSSTPIPLTFRIYDASDATGSKRSEATYSLNQSVNIVTPLSIEIPFANFTTHGPGGAASFSNVGAFQLIINSISTENDLTVELLNTNGRCDHVPQVGNPILDACGDCYGSNLQIQDQCGVCHPVGTLPTDPNWNATCKDCTNTPNGIQIPGTACNTGDLGQCKPGIWDNNCACIPDKSPETEICFDLIDNNCNGQVDENNAQCLDCKGVKGGTAKVDRCGVCDGDGQSCLECNSFEQSATLRRLDGGAKRQLRVVRSLTNLLKSRLPANDPVLKTLESNLAIANGHMLRNWELSWKLPRVSTVCENKQFCVTTSNTPILNEYRQRNDELLKLARFALKALRKYRGGNLSTTDRRYQRLAVAYHKENLALSNTVPVEQFACT